MPFLKRLLKFFIFIAVISLPFNYFFAHFAFNRVLNDFAQSNLVKGQTLKFSSSFHFFPSPFIRIKKLDYKDSSNGRLKISTFKMLINLTQLIKTKSLLVDDFNIDNLTLRLPDKSFDELLKSIMFPLIREGLGVPKDPALHLPSNFEISNVILERSQGGDNVDSYNILKVKYNTNQRKFMEVCFSSETKVQHFYNKFIAQYLIAAKIESKCLIFRKSSKPLAMPKEVKNLPAVTNKP